MTKFTKERLNIEAEALEHFATNLKWTNVRGAQSLLFAADAMRQLLASMEQEPVVPAEITRAALTAEPVAYMYKDNLHADARFSLHTRFGNWSQEDINEYEITEIPLYTAPPAPVVPDGYALVPVEPTAEMIEATFAGEVELQSVQHQIRNRERRAHYYRAMLAAAARPEVK